MFTVLSRIFQYGGKNFWRNGWLSTATIVVMIITSLSFMGLILFKVVADEAVASIQDKIDVSVYFKSSTPEDQILSVKQSLENLSEVKNVDYVSSDQALATFRANHQSDAVISQALNELTGNPLEASLNIKAKSPDQYASIAGYLSAPNLTTLIDSVSYDQNQDVIRRLSLIINNVNRGGLVLIVILSLIAGFVAYNTIRLAIYSNRDEISIMRVVGASNAMVRGPYVVEGIMRGMLAAILSMVIAVPLTYLVSPYLGAFIPGLNIFQYFYMHIAMLLMLQIGFGILLGGVSSFVAVRRYLRD